MGFRRIYTCEQERYIHLSRYIRTVYAYKAVPAVFNTINTKTDFAFVPLYSAVGVYNMLLSRRPKIAGPTP